MSTENGRCNRHARDDHIDFEKSTHTYTINGSSDGVTSVTTLRDSYFIEFNPDEIVNQYYKRWQQNKFNKYYGKSKDEIKKTWKDNGKVAAELGTGLHEAIERFYLNNANNDDKLDGKTRTEWDYFLQFQKQYQLKPYRVEWMIWSSEHKLAGTVDMVVEKDDGKLVMYDWKRSKDKICKQERNYRYGKGPLSRVKDNKYYKYALQLNLYRKLLEDYYDCVVESLYTVRLHPNATTFEVVEMDIMEEEVKKILNERRDQVATHYVTTNLASLDIQE